MPSIPPIDARGTGSQLSADAAVASMSGGLHERLAYTLVKWVTLRTIDNPPTPLDLAVLLDSRRWARVMASAVMTRAAAVASIGDLTGIDATADAALEQAIADVWELFEATLNQGDTL